MKIKIIVHEAEEGGYWAEVPAIPGCVSQGETLEELDDNIREAIVGCLAVDPEGSTDGGFERELDIAV
jgi:predicted RNase H-like HicB family nuclease